MKIIFRNYSEIYGEKKHNQNVDTTFCLSDTSTRECPSDGIPNCDDDRLGSCWTYCANDD